MPDPATTALTAAQHCNSLSALVTDLAVASALHDAYQAQGDASGAEGCRQTIRAATEAVAEHLGFFKEMVK